MNHTQLQALLEAVCTVARGAGELIAAEQSPQVTVKPGHANYVTDMDIASQRYCIERLAPLLPGAGFYAEEQEENRLPAGYCWIIDPIDGTTNYMVGYRHSCVSIGLVQDGEGVLGAVYNPFMGELFCAAHGLGARCNGRPIQVAERPLEQGLVIFGTSPYYRERADETFDVIRRIFLRCGDLRRSGSAALDLCYLAAGRCDGFYEAVLSPWDYAAAAVIVREAGGCIDAIEPDRFGFAQPIGIVAGSRLAFPALRAALWAPQAEKQSGQAGD